MHVACKRELPQSLPRTAVQFASQKSATVNLGSHPKYDGIDPEGCRFRGKGQKSPFFLNRGSSFPILIKDMP